MDVPTPDHDGSATETVTDSLSDEHGALDRIIDSCNNTENRIEKVTDKVDPPIQPKDICISHEQPTCATSDSTKPAITCLSDEGTDWTSPTDYIYHVRRIDFHGETLPTIVQSLNGPCPIIAIANVLLLRKKISLPDESEVLTGQRLVALLSDRLLSPAPTDLDDGQLLNYETLVCDALNLFPSLQTGLDVNVRFTGVSSFEFTSALGVFDLFHIDLYHGWVVDPNERELAEVVGDQSYNQLVELVLEHPKSPDPEIARKGLLAQNFLSHTASQLTYHGLCELSSTVIEGELAVFFRNNHFNTIHKHKGRVYLLVTENSLLNEEPSIAWEALNDVDGDTQFVDSSFALFVPSTKDYRPKPCDSCGVVPADAHNASELQTTNAGDDSTQVLQTSDASKSSNTSATPSSDTSIASTHHKNQGTPQKTGAESWPDSAVVDRDLDLALRLQQEEFEMAGRTTGRRTTESHAPIRRRSGQDSSGNFCTLL